MRRTPRCFISALALVGLIAFDAQAADDPRKDASVDPPASTTAETEADGSADPAEEAALAGSADPAGGEASAVEPELGEAEIPPGVDDWLFDDDYEDDLEWDPLESVNRLSFRGNELFRKALFDPLARVYGYVAPAPVRRSVRRFFTNLSTPSILVNEILQLKLRDAGTTGARFVINTTVGIAGLFDPARAWGLEAQHADFGETMAIYGAGEGPYLVMPFFGPATARDGLGRIVDLALRPDLWLLSAGAVIVILSGDGFTAYEVDRVRLEELRRSSVDFYAALRSAYMMERRAQIAEARLEPRFFAKRPETTRQARDLDAEPADADEPTDRTTSDLDAAGDALEAEPLDSGAGIAEESESRVDGKRAAAVALP